MLLYHRFVCPVHGRRHGPPPTTLIIITAMTSGGSRGSSRLQGTRSRRTRRSRRSGRSRSHHLVKVSESNSSIAILVNLVETFQQHAVRQMLQMCALTHCSSDVFKSDESPVLEVKCPENLPNFFASSNVHSLQNPQQKIILRNGFTMAQLWNWLVSKKLNVGQGERSSRQRNAVRRVFEKDSRCLLDVFCREASGGHGMLAMQ